MVAKKKPEQSDKLISRLKQKNAAPLKLNKNILVGNHIKEQLNKLFYVKEDYDAELEMLKFQYDREEEERVGLHASAITNAGKDFCYREQVLSLFYKQSQGENIPIGLKRIFEEGKSIGTKWQRLFIRGGIGEKEDMDVSRMQPDYDLSYTPDGVIELDGKKYVVEIKSQNTFAFQKQKGHPSGEKQLKLYMFFEGIDKGFVLVDDKNSQDFKVLLITDIDENDEDIARCLDILKKIQVHKKRFVEKKKPPEKLPACQTPDSKRALKCNMREACFGIRRERIGK